MCILNSVSLEYKVPNICPSVNIRLAPILTLVKKKAFNEKMRNKKSGNN